MIAQKNKMKIKFLTGKHQGEERTLNYREKQAVWTIADQSSEHVFAKAK
jgi:uncharacterized membrane protein